jgi:hypothetical protein
MDGQGADFGPAPKHPKQRCLRAARNNAVSYAAKVLHNEACSWPIWPCFKTWTSTYVLVGSAVSTHQLHRYSVLNTATLPSIFSILFHSGMEASNVAFNESVKPS